MTATFTSDERATFMGFDVMASWGRQIFNINHPSQLSFRPTSCQPAQAILVAPRRKCLRRTKHKLNDAASWSGDYNSCSDASKPVHTLSPQTAPTFNQAKAHWGPPTSPGSQSFSINSPSSQGPSHPSRVDSAQEHHQSSPEPSICADDETSLCQDLYEAACTGDLAGIQLLLAQNIPIDTPVPIEDLYDSFKPAKPGHLTPLAGAAGNGQMTAVRFLLAHGAAINPPFKQCTSSPLHQACRSNDLEVVRYLLDHGADVNARNRWQSTPIMYAVKWGSAALARLLFTASPAKPDLDAMTFIGTSAVHWAVWSGNVSVMEVLLEMGADTNMRTEDGTTALHYAAFTGLEQMVEALIKSGADVSARNAEWKTAKDVAVEGGKLEIAKLLESAERRMSYDSGNDRI